MAELTPEDVEIDSEGTRQIVDTALHLDDSQRAQLAGRCFKTPR